ncbi:Holliday junction branch migration protein RuvA [Aerosakkonemataceae cyanobacterium BLCC-F154]|uniref:Holliday junction branch migration complex subunit RuvA n=1 Tax=Floridaenema fluviatile BLCC-F154 TaxID=3153640 RepID=A0ABV4YKU4_9CYAN
MIAYLKGSIAGIFKVSGNRWTLILEVNSIGYELQIPSYFAQQLPEVGATIQVFTHYQVKEEQAVLYGFSSPAERDLFRQLISVSGIGAALAIALLDTLGLPDLVQAIVTGNIRALTKTPGVGNKTAERMALELRTKLSQWRTETGLSKAIPSGPDAAIIEDVEMTLLALGYTHNEVAKAIKAVSEDGLIAKSKNAEDWIRSAISWLSQAIE